MSLDFDMEDLKKVTPTPMLNLPDITEKACYSPINGEPYMVYLCEATKRYQGGCLLCGSLNHQVHGTLPENRLVHDVNIGVTQSDIYLKVRRHRCNDCGGTFVEPVPSVPILAFPPTYTSVFPFILPLSPVELLVSAKYPLEPPLTE